MARLGTKEDGWGYGEGSITVGVELELGSDGKSRDTVSSRDSILTVSILVLRVTALVLVSNVMSWSRVLSRHSSRQLRFNHEII